MYVFVGCFVSQVFLSGESSFATLDCPSCLTTRCTGSAGALPRHTHTRAGYFLHCSALLHPSNGTSVELFYLNEIHFWAGTTTPPQTDTRCVPRIFDSSVSRSAGVHRPGICSAEAPHAAIMTMCTAVQQCRSPAQSRGECINKEVLTGKYPECQSVASHWDHTHESRNKH